MSTVKILELAECLRKQETSDFKQAMLFDNKPMPRKTGHESIIAKNAKPVTLAQSKLPPELQT